VNEERIRIIVKVLDSFILITLSDSTLAKMINKILDNFFHNTE
jgi:hypothetical protein